MTKSNLQYIDAPGGRLVVMPEREFEALRSAAEMANDVAAYDRAKERLEKGEDELIPFEVTERLLTGENPVRVWREFREMTAQRLAEVAGISSGYLSQIESGRRDGTLTTMRALANALGVTLDDLSPPDDPASGVN
ncbi:MAG: helix-turn-helix transcriptional regulator [Rhodospirillales bacterium]|nr:helix-turn-helix transcriptional regulator [Rhodospirillales bacterium]